MQVSGGGEQTGRDDGGEAVGEGMAGGRRRGRGGGVLGERVGVGTGGWIRMGIESWSV